VITIDPPAGIKSVKVKFMFKLTDVDITK